MSGTLLFQIIETLEMDPLGVFTGAIGATLSLFVVNGNSFSWRRTALIMLAGLTVCGYSMVWIEGLVVGENENRALAHLLNILIGYTASDFLSTIKSAAPTATRFIVDQVMSFGKRFFNTNNNDK